MCIVFPRTAQQQLALLDLSREVQLHGLALFVSTDEQSLVGRGDWRDGQQSQHVRAALRDGRSYASAAAAARQRDAPAAAEADMETFAAQQAEILRRLARIEQMQLQ